MHHHDHFIGVVPDGLQVSMESPALAGLSIETCTLDDAR